MRAVSFACESYGYCVGAVKEGGYRARYRSSRAFCPAGYAYLEAGIEDFVADSLGGQLPCVVAQLDSVYHNACGRGKLGIVRGKEEGRLILIGNAVIIGRTRGHRLTCGENCSVLLFDVFINDGEIVQCGCRAQSEHLEAARRAACGKNHSRVQLVEVRTERKGYGEIVFVDERILATAEIESAGLGEADVCIILGSQCENA